MIRYVVNDIDRTIADNRELAARHGWQVVCDGRNPMREPSLFPVIAPDQIMLMAKGFTREDGSHPRPDELLEYFSELYRYGVEVIPMCKCERFCFKHGCRGDGQPKEDNEK